MWLLISYAAIRRVAVPVDPRAETPDPFRFKLSTSSTGGAACRRWALARGVPHCALSLSHSEKKVSSQTETFTNAYDIKRPIETRPRAEMRHVTSLLHP